MREIKFRAWDRYTKEMIFYDFEIFNEEDNGVHSGYEVNNGDWVQLDLMQYAGLKDKNGVDIYEGDVIELGSNKTIVGIVVFNEDDFGVPCFCIREGEESYHTFFAKGDEPRIWFEVIGNIYENPELLHVKE